MKQATGLQVKKASGFVPMNYLFRVFLHLPLFISSAAAGCFA